jgi:4-amino-4-deoxy-L-arabinose transferase-like glycosyltransferase
MKKIINWKLIFLLFFLVLFAVFLFTFKLLSNPPSLETDEASIAYNSALISQNFRDQNNRFLPVFILASDKTDWKQPILIYLTATSFKIFGISLLSYKLVNVFVCLITVILFFYLLKLIFKKNIYAVFGTLTLITTPIVIITTRIGNESILPLFFSTLWLLSLLLFRKERKLRFIVINALTLGIGFYSFKGMRIIIPIWALLSCIFIYFQNFFISVKKTLLNRQFLVQIITFIIFIAPFFLIIPLLEAKYPGAIFDHQSVIFRSIYSFFYYWLSNLSLSFWFTTPDIGKVYTVGLFGAILLVNLPLFLIGIVNAVKKISIHFFILACFIFTPIFFSLPQSINYTHRLIASIPFIIIIITFGFKNLMEKFKNKKYSKYFLVFLTILFSLNFFIFFKFYYFEYPKLNTTQESFGKITYPAFKSLYNQSKITNFIPYIQEDIYNREGDETKFYNFAFFNNSLKFWKLGESLPKNTVLLTQNSSMKNFNNINSSSLSSDLNILISQ